MPGPRLFVVSVPVVCALAACGGDDPTTELQCGTGTSGTLSAGGTVAVTASGGQDLRGAAITAGAATTIPSGEVTIACAPDIVPDGYVALGPAVAFGAEGTWSDRPFELTLPYKAARLPEGAGRRHVRIAAFRPGQPTAFFPLVANRKLDDDDRFASRVTFRAGELTTYQVVAAADAGQPKTEQFGFNAVVGISMGGNAAMAMATKHPDRFDSFADLGGEPGPSMRYTLDMVRKFTFGGFCTAEDEAAGRGNVGQLCPAMTDKPDQFEIESDFEHMLFQDGDGVGLTLQRSLYMKGVRDMARAMSNPAHYNPMNPYAPPGVPFSFMAIDPATRCANPIVLRDFHDREFNPDGSKNVITFCDGGDTRDGLGLGVFDPAQPHLDPAELLLAVDLNNNGKRDAGEPVVTNAFEPYRDVGTDGLADAEEPGYDPVANPDPNHDDYHWQRNPRGTEGNADFDAGEPFDDVGLDGVAGTCQVGSTPPAGTAGCYDFGEGDGTWTLSPNVERWYDYDVVTRVAALTDEQRAHMRMWFDAGIRDFLNNSVATNQGVGQLSGVFGLPFGMYDGFAPLAGSGGESTYDFTTVPWEDVPRHGYVRYGDPDASAAQIMAGDGRHVGTAVQIINRATTAFAWLDKQWPDGDRDDTLDGGQLIKDQTFTSPTTGRVSPFGLFLPPGYDKPENADRRYPVIYFLHGYGQEPQDLVDLSAVFANYMISEQPLEYRFQKFIIVYVDGRCRPQVDGVPVDPTGDLCERGTFYTDAPMGGTARMETNLLDLMQYIDANYRTKASAPVEVTP
ncbi:MAG TPA: alpha/beta hydrolase-fold protein [Kofleriaceae bacterium]|nr:alpha/beta hydrolase-fold protein [Kofleriaceae bacterium]